LPRSSCRNNTSASTFNARPMFVTCMPRNRWPTVGTRMEWLKVDPRSTAADSNLFWLSRRASFLPHGTMTPRARRQRPAHRPPALSTRARASVLDPCFLRHHRPGHRFRRNAARCLGGTDCLWRFAPKVRLPARPPGCGFPSGQRTVLEGCLGATKHIRRKHGRGRKFGTAGCSAVRQGVNRKKNKHLRLVLKMHSHC